MAAITAAMVKELREKTDAPMMECKKALDEAAGDMEKAEELLRVKLGSKASKAASRLAADGLIGLYVAADSKVGAVVEVNSETDFVAKNDEFVAFTKDVAELVAKHNPADVAALAQLSLGGATVETVRTALVGKIGENISIRRFERVASQGGVASYLHGGKIGVLVAYQGDEEVGKDIAMHVAATKPKALDASGVSAVEIEKERSVATAKAAESGKPAEIVAKMIEGSIQKYIKEVTLFSQPFVKDDKQTVEQYLKSKATSVSHFALFVVGEGIEKKTTDFAAEVAAQAAASAKA